MQVGDLKTGQIAVRNSLRQGKSGPSPAIPDLIRSKTAKNICKTHGGKVYYDAKAEFASFSQTEKPHRDAAENKSYHDRNRGKGLKNVLRKIFLWDAPAQGTFFSLTFFFVGSSLWFTFVQLIWLLDKSPSGPGEAMLPAAKIYEMLPFVEGGVLLIGVFSLAVFSRSLFLFLKSCRSRHVFRPLFCLAAALTVSVCAALFCLTPLQLLLKGISQDGVPLGPLPAWAVPASKLPAEYWGFSYLAGTLCMTGGGFLAVASVAWGTGVSLRKAICRRIVVLWGIFWGAYFVLLVFAAIQSCRTAETIAALEKRFGYPLTAAGLEKYYRKQGYIDFMFWIKFGANADKLPGELVVGGRTLRKWKGLSPDRWTPEFLAAFESSCRTNASVLREMEKDFDFIPPLPYLPFLSGDIINQFDFMQLSPCKVFWRWELNKLRASLQKGNKQEALLAFFRMRNCSCHLGRLPSLFGGLFWIACEYAFLDAVESLLESRLLTEKEIGELSAELGWLERQVSAVHLQSMYSEAVLTQDILQGLETGTVIGNVAFADLRFFYPQLWLQCSMDKQFILQKFMARDFSCVSSDPPRSAFVMSKLLPKLQLAGYRFYCLTARARAMRALLQAELYRRKHGNFPETLPDLPLDPFTGKPLLYRCGSSEITEKVLELVGRPDETGKIRENYELNQRKRQGRAVLVWSVGPNRRDDGGLREGFAGTPGAKDDVRAMIRLEHEGDLP